LLYLAVAPPTLLLAVAGSYGWRVVTRCPVTISERYRTPAHLLVRWFDLRWWHSALVFPAGRAMADAGDAKRPGVSWTTPRRGGGPKPVTAGAESFRNIHASGGHLFTWW
jgi:hypothetical protein